MLKKKRARPCRHRRSRNGNDGDNNNRTVPDGTPPRQPSTIRVTGASAEGADSFFIARDEDGRPQLRKKDGRTARNGRAPIDDVAAEPPDGGHGSTPCDNSYGPMPCDSSQPRLFVDQHHPAWLSATSLSSSSSSDSDSPRAARRA